MQIKQKLLWIWHSPSELRWREMGICCLPAAPELCLQSNTTANRSSLLLKHWEGDADARFGHYRHLLKASCLACLAAFSNAPAPPVCIPHSKDTQEHKRAVSKNTGTEKVTSEKGTTTGNAWQEGDKLGELSKNSVEYEACWEGSFNFKASSLVAWYTLTPRTIPLSDTKSLLVQLIFLVKYLPVGAKGIQFSFNLHRLWKIKVKRWISGSSPITVMTTWNSGFCWGKWSLANRT